MERNWKSLLKKQGLVALAAAGIAGGSALTAPKAEAQISGTFGADWYSHFISYGFDVWGGGTGWSDDTINPYFELSWALENFTVFAGTWWDVNDNASSPLGSQLQEVDVWVGVSFDVEGFSFGVTLQEWIYGGQTDTILDLSVGYDDSELWGGDFALNPGFVAHRTTTPTNGSDGWVYVLSVEPGFTAVESDTFTLDVSFPVAVSYGDDNFYADSGLGFFSAGIAASTPLTFIDSSYGDWAANAGLTYYYTDDDQITTNPDDSFVVGNIGLSVSF